MQQLTQAGDQAVQSLAQRYGVSTDAVKTLLLAVNAGGGAMAQFYHPELGGGGQWMRGGMTMVGDMFNSGLQSTVAGLCSELSDVLANQQVFPPAPSNHSGSGFSSMGNNFGGGSNSWWPAELGSPSSSGGQNDSRYAIFPNARRLAVSRNGQVTLYDTLDHQIGGVQQQQGGYAGTFSFSSQFGTFTVESLPLASPSGDAPAPHWDPPAQKPTGHQQAYSAPAQESAPSHGHSNSHGAHVSHDAILSALERLGGLHQKGVLSDDEFRAKKAELLARL